MGSRNQVNPTQVLREFRDLCSMAVEHFEEQILPTIEKKEKSPMNNRRSPVPITLCVNQVLQSGKDQLRAQQNSLPSLSQTNSLSQLEIKVMTIKLTLFSYIYNNFSFYTY